MKSQSISTILRAGALAALFVVGSSAAAFALPIVNFSTSGQFVAGGGGVVQSIGAGTNNSVVWTDGDGTNARITFVGSGLSSVESPTNINYGTMALTLIGGDGEWNGNVAPTTFTMTINQTAPTGGSTNLPASLTGTIMQGDQTDFLLTFAGPGALTFATIGDVNYSIQTLYFLVPPDEGAILGTTTLQGAVNAPSAVPEPATMMLLGTGLLAAFRARRKSA